MAKVRENALRAIDAVKLPTSLDGKKRISKEDAQERMLRSHAGAARFAWNWALAKGKERYRAERKCYSAVSDQGFGAARRMLAYKVERHGGTLIVADRWYPSSKTCGNCGSVKAKLTLSDRTFECEACGHTQDRDVNAARNLLSLAASGARG